MRLEHGIGPVVHRAAEAVEPRRRRVRAPHPLVEREGVQEDDGHSAATSCCSAATDGRSQARSTQSARAGQGSSEIPSRSRARSSQGRNAMSARPNARPLSQGTPREHRVEEGELLLEPLPRPLLAAPERVVRLREVVEAEDEQPPRGALAGIVRPERRLGVALVQVLGDHGRLGQDPAVLLEHRHLARRVHLVEPRGTVGSGRSRPSRTRSPSRPGRSGCGRSRGTALRRRA